MKLIGANSPAKAVSSGPAGSGDGEVNAPQLSGEQQGRALNNQTARLQDVIGVPPLKESRQSSASADNRDASSPFAVRLRRLSGGEVSFDSLLDGATRLLKEYWSLSFVGWFTPAGDRIGEANRLTSLWHESTCSDDCITVSLAALNSTDRLAVSQLATGEHLTAVVIDGPQQNCLVTVAPGHRPAEALTTHELVAARLTESLLMEDLRRADSDSRDTAAFIELISLMTTESTEFAALRRLVDELKRHLGAVSVCIATCTEGRPGCRLRAVSDTAVLDEHSEASGMIQAALQESIARGAASIWPATEEDNRHALLANERLAGVAEASSVVATPLRSESGEVTGSVLAVFRESETAGDPKRAMRFLRAASRPVGTAVRANQRAHQSAVRGWSEATFRVLRGNVGLSCMAFISVVVAILLIPADYRVRCETELQPLSRRYVAAPFAASLQECLVDPGDLVEPEQVLAVMDGREVRWELAGLQADIHKADKENRSYLSSQKFGEAAIARHEFERLQHRSNLLKDRQQSLEIRSPIAGVVVSGDLREREGVPLESGQSLFEIAPLQDLVLEIAIPEADYRHVRSGMNLTFRLDSAPETSIEATVLRVHPKAELRNQENVFIAEAEIQNTDLRFRPGMKGVSMVSTGRRSIGWNLLHKPCRHFIGWLGW